MDIQNEKSAEILFEKQITTQDDLIAVKAYRSLGIFSVHHELLFLVYLSILMLSTGIGILIYENIDAIGHTILIGLILLAATACFYFSFKKTPKYSNTETFFGNVLFNYVVLLGTLLSATFFGYLQFQYTPLGNSFALASLMTSLIGFAAAYRFDNRSALSVAITAIAATLGITVTPRAVMDLDVFENDVMFYTGVALGIMLIIWGEYSEKTDLKKHFVPLFYGFAQHLIGISCVAGMIGDSWAIFLVISAASAAYFYRKSHQSESAALFVFTIVYAFIGCNIALVRLIILSGADDLVWLCIYMAPFFYLAAIVLFIRSIRKFNKEHK